MDTKIPLKDVFDSLHFCIHCPNPDSEMRVSKMPEILIDNCESQNQSDDLDKFYKNVAWT